MNITETDLTARLAALSRFPELPGGELKWLAEHGRVERYEPGMNLAPKGRPIRKLWIMLSGRVTIHVDRGAGPRKVLEWGPGDVTGMLPYSRMAGPPGDNKAEVVAEVVAIPESDFPEMTRECPVFTAHTVHVMLDRARRFNSSDLQDEKMISLGRLAAGLAHELNNPASAAVRGAKLLLGSLGEVEAASRELGAAGLAEDALEAIEQVRATCQLAPTGEVLSPLEQADREDEIAEWLIGHEMDPSCAAPLAETAVTIDALDRLAVATPPEALDTALRWITMGRVIRSLAEDVERSASRIHELVASVKGFTHMDQRGRADLVDVGAGLRDTVAIVSSKAKAKGAAIALDLEADLPPAHAIGGELNQVWLNLIDNALDAVGDSGQVQIKARMQLDKIVVSIIDDGPGIPDDVLPHIFDPFFTTKAPGEGTGLGLEITRRLLRGWHGGIAVESRPGRTEFRVTLESEVPALPNE